MVSQMLYLASADPTADITLYINRWEKTRSIHLLRTLLSQITIVTWSYHIHRQLTLHHWNRFAPSFAVELHYFWSMLTATWIQKIPSHELSITWVEYRVIWTLSLIFIASCLYDHCLFLINTAIIIFNQYSLFSFILLFFFMCNVQSWRIRTGWPSDFRHNAIYPLWCQHCLLRYGGFYGSFPAVCGHQGQEEVSTQLKDHDPSAFRRRTGRGETRQIMILMAKKIIHPWKYFFFPSFFVINLSYWNCECT